MMTSEGRSSVFMDCGHPEHSKREGAHVMTIRTGTYNYATDYEYQRKENDYLRYLYDLLRRKSAGEIVDTSPIVCRLQRAGILNSDGNLAEIFKTGKRS